MVSNAQLVAEMIRWDPMDIPRAFRTQSSDALPSRVNDMILYTQRVTDRVNLLTASDHPHILDKTMDNLKGLCGGQFRLFLGESV